jgi:hypothetical protein
MRAHDHMADAAVEHVPELVNSSPSFSGAELFQEWLLPNITTTYTGDISGAVAANGSFLVGPLVEVPTVLGLQGEFNVSLDVTSDGFVFDFTTKGDPVNFNILDFNGVHVADDTGSLPDLTGVDIAPDSTLGGLDSSRITWGADDVWIDFSGLVFQSGDTLHLTFDF